MEQWRLLLTCEHGGNRIPPAYADYFAEHRDLLDTHRGFDAGALVVARDFVAAFEAPLIASTTSRLLADLNRSANHPHVHGPGLRDAPPELRRAILARYHTPYRSEVQMAVSSLLAEGVNVVHLSCHSFTPEWDGQPRQCDIGLLFDPRRTAEGRLCRAWQARLRAAEPTLAVRRNYPYRGISDGLTSALRRRFPAERYVGIELEVNQRYPLAGGKPWRAIRALLVESFRTAHGVLEERTRRAGNLRSEASSRPS
jgi:predicted N-formylglutamate amidohydrolase